MLHTYTHSNTHTAPEHLHSLTSGVQLQYCSERSPQLLSYINCWKVFIGATTAVSAAYTLMYVRLTEPDVPVRIVSLASTRFEDDSIFVLVCLTCYRSCLNDL